MALKKEQSITTIKKKSHRRISLLALEDAANFSLEVGKIGQIAGKNALAEAKVLKLPVTYLKGSAIVRETAHGSIEIIGHVKSYSSKVKFQKGIILHAKKIG